MQVILLKDVPRVGKKLDVVTVSDGYASNFLFPKKLAEPATPKKVLELESRREAMKAEEDAKIADLKEKLTSLQDADVTITAKADGQGNLYKKIHAADIAHALKEDHDIELPETSILLDAPLHEVGDHEIPLEAVGEKVTLTVTIIAE